MNERLEFQVQQLRVEKDNIHHVLATFKEGHEFPRSTPNDHRGILMMMTTSATSAAGKFGTVFFSAEAGSNSTGGSGGVIKVGVYYFNHRFFFSRDAWLVALNSLRALVTVSLSP